MGCGMWDVDPDPKSQIPDPRSHIPHELPSVAILVSLLDAQQVGLREALNFLGHPTAQADDAGREIVEAVAAQKHHVSGSSRRLGPLGHGENVEGGLEVVI